MLIFITILSSKLLSMGSKSNLIKFITLTIIFDQTNRYYGFTRHYFPQLYPNGYFDEDNESSNNVTTRITSLLTTIILPSHIYQQLYEWNCLKLFLMADSEHFPIDSFLDMLLAKPACPFSLDGCKG